MKPGSTNPMAKAVKSKVLAGAILAVLLAAAIFAANTANTSSTTSSRSLARSGGRANRKRSSSADRHPDRGKPAKSHSRHAGTSRAEMAAPLRRSIASAAHHPHGLRWHGRTASAANPSGKLVWAKARRRKRPKPTGEFAGISERSGAAGMPPADQLLDVNALAAGPNGSVFALEYLNMRVLKITQGGEASVYAGNGFNGYSGDGGQATKAELLEPHIIAADKEGNLYITDTDRIRRVDASTHVITTVAGNGKAPWEDHCEGQADGTTATSAVISPSGLVTDPAGHLYFLDSYCNSLFKVSGGEIHLVAHGGLVYASGFFAFNGTGNLLSTADHGIREITPEGTITTFAGYPGTFESGFGGDGGPAAGALFWGPQQIAMDGSGNLLIADSGNYRIREIDTEGNIHTLAGAGGGEGNGDGGPAYNASFYLNNAVAVDTNGNVDVGEYGVYGALRQIQAKGGSVSPSSIIRTIPEGPDLQGESNGGCNPSENCCAHGCQGDPVDTATGDYWQRDSDLSIPGRGMPIGFTRTYSSIGAQENEAPGPMGHGWAFSYGMWLSESETTGDITIYQENGSTVLFVPNEAGTAYTSETRVLATLVHNESGTWTFARKARHKFTFDAGGKLVSEKDLNGETTTLSYNGEGQLGAIADSAGRELAISYTEAGRIESIADPEGREVKYGYEEGNLTEVTDIGGGTWRYTYDEDHRLKTEKDPRGHVILTNNYDGAGRVESQTDGDNRETGFSYGNGETTVTGPAGNETRYVYSGSLLSEKIEGLGSEDEAVWSYEYDPTTLGIASITDPDGNTTTSEYNSAGDLTQRKDPLGHKTSFSYDALNDRTSIKDAKGITTTLSYDGTGNLTKSSTPIAVGCCFAAHQVWEYAHEHEAHPGDVTAITDPNGNTTSLDYNADGDLTSVIDAEEDKTTFAYNAIGQRTSVVSPRGYAEGGKAAEHTTEYEYTPFGDIEKIVDPLKGETTLEYDGDRNLASTTDPDENTTTYVYDKANQLEEIDRADSSVLKDGYDEDGNLEFQTDGAGEATIYSYDPLDRLASVTDPLNRTTEYTYDAVGNLKELIDPLKRTTTYEYDEANRLHKIKYSDGETPEATFGYDEDNQLTSMTDGTGPSSFVYDELRRPTEATQQGIAVGFGYDLANNETGITYPGSHEVTRAFDKANRLKSVTDWSSNKTSFGYDADSDLHSITFPSGTTNVDEYGYDKADRLGSVAMKKGEATVASLIYARDPLGQVEGEEQTGLPGAASTSYGYTLLNQLSSAGADEYGYSSADNATKLAGISGYEYDEANELKSIPAEAPGGAATLSYNALGERTELNPESGPTTEYSYDQAGRLVGVGSETYAYDGGGLRLAATKGEETKHFSWDRNSGLPLLLSDGSTRYVYGPGGLPVEQVSSGGTATYYHHDQLGSTRMLTNASGEATGAFSYTPYGVPAAGAGEQTTPLGFAGQYTDPGSGLQYLRARYYDSITGQFLSVDPLAALTRSAYGYVGDDPMNGMDPTGENWLGLPIPTPGELLEPLNPLKYYGEEIEAIENGCSYWESIQHGLQGASVGFLDVSGLGALTERSMTTAEQEEATPAGRPMSSHYLTETGPIRNIPVSVLDEAIDNGEVAKRLADRTIYYDAVNDVTVVVSETTGKIMSARRGSP